MIEGTETVQTLRTEDLYHAEMIRGNQFGHEAERKERERRRDNTTYAFSSQVGCPQGQMKEKKMKGAKSIFHIA